MSQQPILMPTYPAPPVTFVRGEGSRLWDDEGGSYLDFLSGLGVTSLGHAHPEVAAAIAAALPAEKLVYLTDVEGIRSDPGDPSTLVSTLTVDELDHMVADGTVKEGMIPKVASCVAAVRAGVGHAHVLDGRVPHVLLLEFFTRSGIGTMVTR